MVSRHQTYTSMQPQEIATVETDLFEHREVKPHFINDCCFSEDFAVWLRQRLVLDCVVLRWRRAYGGAGGVGCFYCARHRPQRFQEAVQHAGFERDGNITRPDSERVRDSRWYQDCPARLTIGLRRTL